MRTALVARRLGLSVCAAIAVGAVLSPAANAAPTANASASCRTATQNIEARHNVTCAAAQQIANKALDALGYPWPECKGDPKRSWNGWTLSPSPVMPGELIGTKFSKGAKSFRITGGGAC